MWPDTVHVSPSHFALLCVFKKKKPWWCMAPGPYKRQLIQFKMIKKWPTWSGMEDSRPIFSCKRFSYNENALYRLRIEHASSVVSYRTEMDLPKFIVVICVPWATVTVFLHSWAPFVAAIQSTTQPKWPLFLVSKRTIAAHDLR